MLELIESVKKHGVLVPAIARPKPDGGYELVAGHRRQRASQLAGLDSMPVIVMNLDDNDTIIQLVDSNIQRENILPSERAKAYKLRMEAVKKKAGRPQKEEDQNSPKISANFRSDDSIGELAGVSGDTIRNYISLTNLINTSAPTHYQNLIRLERRTLRKTLCMGGHGHRFMPSVHFGGKSNGCISH